MDKKVFLKHQKFKTHINLPRKMFQHIESLRKIKPIQHLASKDIRLDKWMDGGMDESVRWIEEGKTD